MLISDGKRQRNKPGAMSLSEVMTLLDMFHLFGFRNLKTFYNGFVCRSFSKRVSAFVELHAICRMAPRCVDSGVVLSTRADGQLHGHRICGCDDFEGLSEFTDTAPSGFRRQCAGRGQTSVGWFSASNCI